LIKNPSTAVSKACCAIKAEKRWCVTGTPVINSLDDIYGLLKFLKHEPWSDSSFWKNLISRAMTERSSDTSDSKNAEKITKIDGSNGGMQIALNRARRILSPLLLRRTKDMVDDNGYVLNISTMYDSVHLLLFDIFCAHSHLCPSISINIVENTEHLSLPYHLSIEKLSKLYSMVVKDTSTKLC
jgi:hypothetical protein